jgi:hypothetical protein
MAFRAAGFTIVCVTLACVCATLACVSPAFADGPWWHVGSGSRPSELPSASETGGQALPGEGEIVVSAENVGDAATAVESEQGTSGERAPIAIVDQLPAGLRAVGISGVQPALGGAPGSTIPLSCTLEDLRCESSAAVVPYDQIEVRIKVEVLRGASSGERNVVGVSGGGAPAVTVSRPISVGDHATPFGVERFELSAEGEGGGRVTQAGAHPYQVTGTIALNQSSDVAPLTSAPQAGSVENAKDMIAKLPAGLTADPGAVPRCLSWQFSASLHGEQDECPYQTAVGVASVTFAQPGGEGTRTLATPVFDIEPEAGEPARFGFFVPIVGVPVTLTTSVRSGSGEDWGVNLSAAEIPQSVGISSVRLTLWGVPGRSSHDESRGWGCLAASRERAEASYESCVHVENQDPPAFVTLPTACAGPLQSSVLSDTWTAPGEFQTVTAGEALPALTGCEHVPFSPSISVSPSTHSASSPSGLSFDLNFNTEGLTSPEGIAQSDLADTVVTLPEGVTIDPSAGVGLGACTEAQYAQATLTSPAGTGCPEDSKLGTVEIETPLMFTTIYGSLYVAQPYENPFSEPGHPTGSLVAVYVIARSRAERGVLIKLAGQVTPNPETGRLTVTFEGDPQLPFDHFNFHFKEGAQAALITPATCGTYTSSAELTPFSRPAEVLDATSSFQVSSGSEGGACPSGALPPFAPRISAGTLSEHAGSFSPLYVELSRTDAMSEIGTFSTSLPIGLTADLSGIPFCPQADIEQARAKTGAQEQANPSCPAASLIGHSLVGTGVGAVLDYVPGALYLSGPFHGDPLSVVSVTSAVVGPFDLGTIVIHFALRVNPYTAQVSIDPSGSEPIPTIIDGIVTHVRDIRVSIDRAGFTLNPTSCAALPISSALTSSLAQSASTSTTLQATGCEELAFKPIFDASTKGKTSRAGGASLSVKLKMPIKLGTQSNIKEVKVSLPKQLPSRLTTLQQACTEKQFNANPAGCPVGSVVGHATASTPILPVPLTGPAIFVSHGGEAFPSLILVLQGYGVTIDLVGTTFVNEKTGVTSTTFKTVPDEPVGSFELTLPQGRFSALAATANLCKLTRTILAKRRRVVVRDGHRHTVTLKTRRTVPGTLRMPTLFVAQNGAIIKRSTPVGVTGCPRKKTSAAKHHRKGGKGR